MVIMGENLMKREKAVAILKDIMANRKIQFKWGFLVNGKSVGYELHVESDVADGACLKPIVEKHSLSLKETSGLFIIYKEH